MYDYIKIPEIVDGEKFENLTLDLFARVLDRTQKNGRRGQRQNGVDIFGFSNTNQLTGIQCKAKSKAEYGDKNFRASFIKEIKREVIKATAFNHRLKLFIIMTTAPRDSEIQDKVIEIDADTYSQHGFHLQVKFWEDIEQMLTDVPHKETFKKYYSDLIIREKPIGGVQGKIFSLNVGVENEDDSVYQLFLGYIPKLTSYPNGIEYYSNTYVLGCFQTKGFDTFPKRCFPSDLDLIFPTEGGYMRDKYTISDWLNTIHIDEEINNDCREYEYYWSEDRFEEFRNLTALDEDV